MKQVLLFAFAVLCLFLSADAQSPNAIPYQAAARNTNGSLIINQHISLRFSIHDGSVSGPVVYSETQDVITNAYGLFSVNIGQGNPVTGTFTGINWGNGSKFTQVEMDAAGGTNYTDMGTQQMMSVPYAMYASNGNPNGTAAGQMLYWNGTAWVIIAAGVPGQILQLNNTGIPEWTNSNNFPVVSTTSAGSITNSTAVSGGAISSDGGSAVTARGVCWSTSPNPTLSNSFTTDGAGTGSFTSAMTGLAGNTTYYARAYATNSSFTAYGNQINFTTLAVPPTLTTATTSAAVNNSATSGGDISYDGGSPVTARGVCWSTSPGPTLADNFTTNGAGSGSFSSTITGLSLFTTYYVRAYATNAAGTSYGNEKSFVAAAIGQVYGGGKIAYIYQPGDPGYVAGQPHGLIAASADQSTAIQWYNGSFFYTYVYSTALGTGNSNTSSVVSLQGAGSYAAQLCYDLSLNGYSDWFLPSKDEMDKLFLNRNEIGGFNPNGSYWTSSDLGPTQAYAKLFFLGTFDGIFKDRTLFVRAVRYF